MKPQVLCRPASALLSAFHQLPHKVPGAAAVWLTSSGTILMACAACLFWQAINAREQMVQSLETTAAITAASSTAGSAFADAHTMERAVKSLSAQRDIIQACVYDQSGRPLARYWRPDAKPNNPPPVSIAGHRFDHQRLELIRAIHPAGPDLGSIYLEQDSSRLDAQFRKAIQTGLFVWLGGTAMAWLFLVSLVKRNAATRPHSLDAARDADLERRVKERTQALAESEANYYSLVDQMPAGIFRKNKQGRYVFVNSWFCRFKGISAENFLGKLPIEVIPEPSQSAAQQAATRQLAAVGSSDHAAILQTGRQIEADEECVGPDGIVRYFHSIKSPVYGPDRTVVGSQGILLDVTQHKLAEAELAYEQDLLRTLLDNSTDHIYFKDTRSHFIKSSNAQARQFGVASSDELLGKSDFDFFSDDHARPAFEDEQEIIRTGQPMIGRIERETWKDGRKQSWVLTTKMPLRDKAGKIIGTFGISKDITPIKETEQALAYERDLLKALLDQSPDSIFFKDRESKYVRLSRSEVGNLLRIAINHHAASHPSAATEALPPHLASLERFHEFVIGKSDADIYGPERAAEFRHDEQEIMRTGTSLFGKIEKTISADGQPVWFLTTKTPWHNQAGEIIGTFGSSRNITDLKQAEAQIELAHQQLLETSRLAGMAEVATSVLHNVGNVLNSVNVSTTLVVDLVKKSRLNNLGRLASLIRGQHDNLAAFFTKDPRGREFPDYLEQLTRHLTAEQAELVGEIELIRKNIEHIKDIVTMQQTYAKVSGIVEKVKVTELVEDALRINAGALARHHVEIARDYPAESIECAVERQKVLQILVNVIRNAKYACDESGRTDKRLTLQVRLAGGRAQIAILDNGVGIPAENMTRIFNHGFTTREHGHGFGLHSGALAAKELGGSLTAYSDGPGKGARFVLDLPLQPPQKS